MARNFKKRIFRILKWGSIIFVLLLGIAISLPYIFEDEVVAAVVKEINSHVKADIKVEDIKLSVIKRFPHASLQFEKVKIEPAKGFEDKGNLFEAKRIFIKFSILNLFQKNYSFDKIEFVDVVFNPTVNKKGDVNYDIFYPDAEKKESQEEIFVNLKGIQLTNVKMRFENQLTKQLIDIDIEDLKAKATFGNNKLWFDIKSKLEVISFAEDNIVLINQKHINTEIEVKYSAENQKLDIEKGNIQYESLALLLSGSIQFIEEGSDLDLHLKLAQLSISELIQELPSEQRKPFEAYHLNGNLKTDIHIFGHTDKKNLPSIEADFTLQKGTTKLPEQDLTIDHIELTGNFSNGSKKSVTTSHIALENFSFKTKAGFFEGNLEVNNLKNPILSLSTNSNIELSAIHALMSSSVVEQMEGRMDLKLNTKIRIEQWQDSVKRNFSIDRLKGSAQLHSVLFALTNDQRSFKDINGEIEFAKDKIKLKDIKVNISGQDIDLDGEILHIASLLNPLSTEKISFEAKLQAPAIDFNLLLDDGQDSPYTGNLPDNFDISIGFKIGTFTWDDYKANNAIGNLELKDGDLTINPLRFDALEGAFKGELNYLCSNPEFNLLQTKGTLKDMNVSAIFETFKNFNQETLTSKNIKGKLTSDFDLHIIETKQGEWIEESLSCDAHTRIDNGELINVKELNALTTYTRINDFNHIIFQALENDIQINKSQIFIPEMAINSNKMNIHVFGKHSFSNIYEYHFKIKLNEILAKKVKENRQTEFGEIEEEQSEGKTLFLVMKGQGEKFDVKYDKGQASGEMKNDIKEEGNEVKKVLKEEFGPKDTPKSKERQEKRRKKKEEKELIKKQEEGNVILEWDEI